MSLKNKDKLIKVNKYNKKIQKYDKKLLTAPPRYVIKES